MYTILSRVYFDVVTKFGRQEEITRLSHIAGAKKELITRINRIQGQLDAIRDAVEGEQECATLLQQVAACRGGINSLMAEIIEREIKMHVLAPNTMANSPQASAADEVIDMVRRYIR
jgi:DNA-binding FrmR family transcriptional regulator